MSPTGKKRSTIGGGGSGGRTNGRTTIETATAARMKMDTKLKQRTIAIFRRQEIVSCPWAAALSATRIRWRRRFWIFWNSGSKLTEAEKLWWVGVYIGVWTSDYLKLKNKMEKAFLEGGACMHLCDDEMNHRRLIFYLLGPTDACFLWF